MDGQQIVQTPVVLALILAAAVIAGCGPTLRPGAEVLTTDFQPHSGIGTAVLGLHDKAAAEQQTNQVHQAANKRPHILEGAQKNRSNNKSEKALASSFESYVIGPGDVLEINVFKVPELSRRVQVAATGTINLPLIGTVPAAQSTPQDLEQSLAEKLGKDYLENPQVQVYVKDFRSQRVTVEGAVNKPGLFPLEGTTTLLQVVARAGGLTSLSDETNIVIFRDSRKKRTAARFDVTAIRDGTTKDPVLKAGDVVVVHQSGTKQAFENFVRIIPVARVFVPIL
ncbi:MAG: polysaccharide biosynthesis/export family protein [Pseudomonadota bacterium]